MENNIEYWKNKIQKESGIPPHFFEIINNQELYNNKQKAKFKKIGVHIRRKLNVQYDIFIRKINKNYQRKNNGKLFWSSKHKNNRLLLSMLYSVDKINKQVNSISNDFEPIDSIESPSINLKYVDYHYKGENINKNIIIH